MAVTVSEANAINVLIDFIYGDSGSRPRTPERAQVDAAAATLADSAHKRLMAGATAREVQRLAEHPTGRSALAAIGVCEAICSHLSHGGKLPWPTISKPYTAWVTAPAGQRRRDDS